MENSHISKSPSDAPPSPPRVPPPPPSPPSPPSKMPRSMSLPMAQYMAGIRASPASSLYRSTVRGSETSLLSIGRVTPAAFLRATGTSSMASPRDSSQPNNLEVSEIRAKDYPFLAHPYEPTTAVNDIAGGADVYSRDIFPGVGNSWHAGSNSRIIGNTQSSVLLVGDSDGGLRTPRPESPSLTHVAPTKAVRLLGIDDSTLSPQKIPRLHKAKSFIQNLGHKHNTSSPPSSLRMPPRPKPSFDSKKGKSIRQLFRLQRSDTTSSRSPTDLAQDGFLSPENSRPGSRASRLGSLISLLSPSGSRTSLVGPPESRTPLAGPADSCISLAGSSRSQDTVARLSHTTINTQTSEPAEFQAQEELMPWETNEEASSNMQQQQQQPVSSNPEIIVTTEDLRPRQATRITSEQPLISVCPVTQAGMYAWLEGSLLCAASDFLMDQEPALNLAHLIKEVDAWRNAQTFLGSGVHFRRALPLNFMFGIEFQCRIIEKNLEVLHFSGPMRKTPQGIIAAWKSILPNIAIRSFCHPDYLILEHFRVLEKVHELLGPGYWDAAEWRSKMREFVEDIMQAEAYHLGGEAGVEERRKEVEAALLREMGVVEQVELLRATTTDPEAE